MAMPTGAGGDPHMQPAAAMMMMQPMVNQLVMIPAAYVANNAVVSTVTSTDVG